MEKVIKITGIIERDVQPMEGTSLYSMPFQLSSMPDGSWIDFFVDSWDHPTSWSSSHRPGVASVSSNVITLKGMTFEDFQRVHKNTLEAAVEAANRKWNALEARHESGLAETKRLKENERQKIAEGVKNIKF